MKFTKDSQFFFILILLLFLFTLSFILFPGFYLETFMPNFSVGLKWNTWVFIIFYVIPGLYITLIISAILYYTFKIFSRK
ncbi:hypothetical protein A2954_02020 [Candidatus Roizmanbacteria bacterium RIFCSPLOWO2_01_FULL_37_12]|uniref:Uncharacterized protein n=1 Tax=Candidatus Roizmanbacteria bacterium RIFCSPLOWO2_01_FULL_37_12 TaxID=1802056 RepID=A0A1F7IFH0_9BACT|nr:MAG: hypothetical protein A3D76_06630 [Candidatus Roizmanbacteria bacterium RIFCSPHIGHO2_02_FULL_37_9b]OGK42104.1 MAG: hypothetical protein A2954_02020 [Candidatus Roizmanbacteria bacterium RIFCSPLOWO2_01_FULL_37_12]